MPQQTKVKLGFKPSDIQKLGIAYEVGRFLENAFERTIYLHEGYRIYITGYRLNNYMDSGFYGSSHIRSYVRLDFMDFLFFFIELLKGRQGKIQLQASGKFRLLIPSRSTNVPIMQEVKPEEKLVTLQLGLPALFNRDCLKLQIDFSEEDSGRSSESFWIDLIKELEKYSSHPPIEPRRGKWCELKPVEVSYLFRAMNNYCLKELFKIFCEINPIRNQMEFLAGLDIPKYKEDRRKKLLDSIVEFERKFTSKRAKKNLRKVKDKILKEAEASTLLEAVKDIEERKLIETEREMEFLYISRGIKDNPISKAKPKREIKFKLWERDLEDLFTGNYSGTCIALDERKDMPSYLKDPYTEFFRILANERRIGHVKMFYCTDEDGENVLHIDYIGLSGGRFKPLQDEIKRYAINASIRLAQMKGLKRVYVAQEIVPDLDGQLVRNRLVKRGQDIYSQYLEAKKFLVWEKRNLKMVELYNSPLV